MEHEAARAEPEPVPIAHAEGRLSVPGGAAQLLRLQRDAGNRAVAGRLRRESRRRLARADTATAPGLPSPAFTIPVATETLEILPVFNGYTAQIRNFRETFVGYAGNCADAALATFKKLTLNQSPGLYPFEPGGWQIVRLQAIDNATYDKVRRFPEFDVSWSGIRKPAWETIGIDAADREYQLTQVRVYEDDVERMKSAGAWWD